MTAASGSGTRQHWPLDCWLKGARREDLLWEIHGLPVE